jgi:hypothetical protein
MKQRKSGWRSEKEEKDKDESEKQRQRKVREKIERDEKRVGQK